MNHGYCRDASPKFPGWAHVLALVLGMGSLCWGAADTQSRILVLPFLVSSGDHQADLRSFSDHVSARIRAAVNTLGPEYVLIPEQVTDELLKGKDLPSTEEQARSLGLECGADLMVYGFLSYKDARYQMTGAMWDLRTGRNVVSTDLKVDNIHGLPGVLQAFTNLLTKHLHGTSSLPLYRADPAGTIPGTPTDRAAMPVSLPRSTYGGSWRSPEMEGAIFGLDMGDMVGDKRSQIVFVEDSRITISRLEGGGLKPLTQFSETPVVYLAAEVEDLDGDGVAELLLCYQTPSGLESAIVRYTNRNLEVIAKFPNMILRTVVDPYGGKKRVLVGQKTDSEDMFGGEMVRFVLEGGKPVPSGTLRLPPGTLLLSYTSEFTGEHKDFVQIILNQDQRLMVFDRDNQLLGAVEDRMYGLNRKIRIPFKNGYRDIALPGRLMLTDTSGDGEAELLVVKQVDGLSEIQSLIWEPGGFREKWRTIRSSGIISDFRIRDFRNSGVRSLVLVLIKPSPFFALTGPRSVVYAYDLLP